jgi:hypothetical protein
MLAGLKNGEDKRAVAVRAALRGLYGLARIDDAPWSLSEEVGLPIMLHALRAVFVSWCGTLYRGVRPDAGMEAVAALNPLLARIDEALPDFYAHNFMSSDAAVAAWQSNVEAGRRAAGLVQAINVLEFPTFAFDSGRNWTDSFDTLAHFGPDAASNQAAWRAAQRTAVGADCEVLGKMAATRSDLILAPLWPTAAAAALATNLCPLRWEVLGPHLEIWLRERKDGALVMGKSPQAMEARMVGIANFPPAFWKDRDAKDALDAFDYALHGSMDNPHWGA